MKPAEPVTRTRVMRCPVPQGRSQVQSSARGAAGVLGQGECAETEGERVDEEELAGGILAEGGDGADDLQRGEAAHHPGERAEHALFGTADAGAVGILADEAAIAGPVCLPAAEHAELAFELRYRGRDERD